MDNKPAIRSTEIPKNNGDREEKCPGPLASISSIIRKHYKKQWEKNGLRHWWRFSWLDGTVHCKFCKAPPIKPRRKAFTQPEQVDHERKT